MMKSKEARENAAPADKSLYRFVTAPFDETIAGPVQRILAPIPTNENVRRM